MRWEDDERCQKDLRIAEGLTGTWERASRVTRVYDCLIFLSAFHIITEEERDELLERLNRKLSDARTSRGEDT